MGFNTTIMSLVNSVNWATTALTCRRTAALLRENGITVERVYNAAERQTLACIDDTDKLRAVEIMLRPTEAEPISLPAEAAPVEELKAAKLRGRHKAEHEALDALKTAYKVIERMQRELDSLREENKQMRQLRLTTVNNNALVQRALVTYGD